MECEAPLGGLDGTRFTARTLGGVTVRGHAAPIAGDEHIGWMVCASSSRWTAT